MLGASEAQKSAVVLGDVKVGVLQDGLIKNALHQQTQLLESGFLSEWLGACIFELLLH